jgi:hypothetical protein
LVSCDGIFLSIDIEYIHVPAYPYGVLGTFTADIDNGVRKSMCINFIIICWSVHETEMTMEEDFFCLPSQSLMLFLVPGFSMCFNGNK